ncbi:MAG: HD domain-containing protein, partial [Anaerolineales bacterium]|nr:HD domain-containing protein [Anaerolineales bacterium]
VRFPSRSELGLPLIAGGRRLGAAIIAYHQPHAFTAEEIAVAERAAGPVALAVAKARLFDELQTSHARLTEAYDATLEGWAIALELRDKETEGHTRRVTETTLRLARRMGLPEADLVNIRRGALLHDIGKIGIPDDILRKPGPLTEAEQLVMRKHPTYAYEIIAAIPFLYPAIDIPYCHHEKWDGTGYPRGLLDEAIPLAARLFAVVDVWDALRSDRPYRESWPSEKVVDHIRLLSGSHFDPQVVDAFLAMLAADVDSPAPLG